jgi:hypothetical protein
MSDKQGRTIRLGCLGCVLGFLLGAIGSGVVIGISIQDKGMKNAPELMDWRWFGGVLIGAVGFGCVGAIFGTLMGAEAAGRSAAAYAPYRPTDAVAWLGWSESSTPSSVI